MAAAGTASRYKTGLRLDSRHVPLTVNRRQRTRAEKRIPRPSGGLGLGGLGGVRFSPLALFPAVAQRLRGKAYWPVPRSGPRHGPRVSF